MTNTKEPLVIYTPIRKRLGGLWLMLMGGLCLAMWNSGVKGAEKSSYILPGIAFFLLLLGLYKLLSFNKTLFHSGEMRVEQQQMHFGFYQKNLQMNFDKIDLLKRDSLLPYCQIYAYTSMEKLAESTSRQEMEVYEKDLKPLPGVVVVDHTTKKECLKLIEKIWRFYDRWEELAEQHEKQPRKAVLDEEDDFDEED